MCGICGIVATAPEGPPPSAESRAAAMLHLLTHRGPHESRLEALPTGSIGATRLAIRGVDTGSQPMVDPATGVVVACNGEIDNHAELRARLAGRGHTIALDTDIAVIPALYLEYGDRFPEHLVGSFAAAVWDPRARTLLLARDRGGEKPLFYATIGGEISFAFPRRSTPTRSGTTCASAASQRRPLRSPPPGALRPARS
jgi:asparagine synthase (glutamine-hydrolysing)